MLKGNKMLALILFSIGFFVGGVDAHSVVARECTLLGKFYVGKTVYECTPIAPPTQRNRTETGHKELN